MQLKNCEQAWFEMQIEYNTHIQSCCYYKSASQRWDSEKGLDIPAYWNGEYIRNIRRIVKSNQSDNTGCRQCQYINFTPDTYQAFQNIPDNINAQQRKNWEQAILDYENRSEYVNSLPSKYYFNFGLACNYQCVMCCQENARKADRRELPLQLLLNQKDYLSIANEFHLIGGEPLVVPSARKFIDIILSEPAYQDIQLVLYTNGSLLHHYETKFQKLQRLTITVSLDGVGEVFEKIRLNASWNQVERNLLALKEFGEFHNLNWNIYVSCVVMKSNLLHLSDILNWCHKHSLSLCLVPVIKSGYQHPEKEDIFDYPQLLQELPGWKESLQQALDLSENAVSKNTYTALKKMQDILLAQKPD